MKVMASIIAGAFIAAAVAAQQPPRKESARLWTGPLGLYEFPVKDLKGAGYVRAETDATPRKPGLDVPSGNVDNLFGITEPGAATTCVNSEGCAQGFESHPSPGQREYKSRFSSPPPGVFTRPAIPGSVQSPSSEQSRQGTNLFEPLKKLLDKRRGHSASTSDSSGGAS